MESQNEKRKERARTRDRPMTTPRRRVREDEKAGDANAWTTISAHTLSISTGRESTR